MKAEKSATDEQKPTVCDGCGKVPKNTLREHCPDGLVKIAVAPERHAYVCMAARSRYGTDPIGSCADAAVAKAKFCRGCGAAPPDRWRSAYFDARFEVCPDCRLALERGRAAQAVEPRAWYVMAPDALVPYWGSRHVSEEARNALATALVAFAAGTRTVLPEDAPVTRIAFEGELTEHRPHYSDRFAELTEAQAVGFRGIVEQIRILLGQSWSDGMREGRSVFTALLEGEITIAKYDERVSEMVQAGERHCQGKK